MASVISGCTYGGPAPLEPGNAPTERRLNLAASVDITDSSVGLERTPIEGSAGWAAGNNGLSPGNETAVLVDFDPREPAGPEDYSVRREALGTVEVDNAEGDGSLVLREARCDPDGQCAGSKVHLGTDELQPGTYVHTFEVTWTADRAADPVAASGTVRARLVVTVT